MGRGSGQLSYDMRRSEPVARPLGFQQVGQNGHDSVEGWASCSIGLSHRGNAAPAALPIISRSSHDAHLK